ncbi:hypothetical protein B0H21DRAFT_894782 [Amylocystis lapponica]|nr:hypothetical protein B0H21DRAFT_894782 [Amylocystis lapponica]
MALLLWFRGKSANKDKSPPGEAATQPKLRFGLLGAARIAPNALIRPIQGYEEAVLTVVGARAPQRATAFAKKWGIPKVYSGEGAYQRVIDDEEVDAVYIPLPNGLHYEWTMKAIAAGKHVLCEKPISNTEEEARKMFAFAQEKGVVLMECWQPQFHPAMHRVKAIIDEGSLGKILKVSAQLGVWRMLWSDDDIRFDYSLGGGTLMDMGPYPVNAVRYLTSSVPTVESAEAICRRDNIDRRIEAHLSLSNGASATIMVDSALDGWGPFKLIPQFAKLVTRVECEHGSVEIFNYVLPSLFNRITVTKNGKSWSERVYKTKEGKGETSFWSAYRHQLEAFVDKVRGREPQSWRTAEDSIESMHIIDAIYTKCGLPLRPTSEYTLGSA